MCVKKIRHIRNNGVLFGGGVVRSGRSYKNLSTRPPRRSPPLMDRGYSVIIAPKSLIRLHDDNSPSHFTDPEGTFLCDDGASL